MEAAYLGEKTELHIAYLVKAGAPPKEIIEYVLASDAGLSRVQVEQEVMGYWEANLEIDIKQDLFDDIRTVALSMTGVFSFDDVRKVLCLKDSKSLKFLMVCLNRLVNQGAIETVGDKHGQFRVTCKEEDERTVFLEKMPDEFRVWLPMGINSLVELYPKSIVIVAGSKSAGKTTVLLNIALANQCDNDVVYFNSEMGDAEWTKRLHKFGINKPSQIRFDVWNRYRNFHDKIDGSKKIFVIDFMEIHDNFYEIAKYIRQIHEKLKDGICIIALQKDAKSELSRGGAFSAEKARLYLTLDYAKDKQATKVTIYDAKIPRDGACAPGESPKGLYRHVKIIGGNLLSPIEDWTR